MGPFGRGCRIVGQHGQGEDLSGRFEQLEVIEVYVRRDIKKEIIIFMDDETSTCHVQQLD